MILSNWYYLRDTNNIPLVTVMLAIDDEGRIARGISLCSPDDNPNKRIGRKYAMEHALDALDAKDDIAQNQSAVVNFILDSVDKQELFDMYTYKAWFMPELSDFEIDLINKAVNKVDKFSKEFNES